VDRFPVHFVPQGAPLPLAPTILHTSACEDGTDRRFRNFGNYKPDAGELP